MRKKATGAVARLGLPDMVTGRAARKALAGLEVVFQKLDALQRRLESVEKEMLVTLEVRRLLAEKDDALRRASEYGARAGQVIRSEVGPRAGLDLPGFPRPQ